MNNIPSAHKRFRMIIPASPNAGIFNRFNKKITSLGAVLIATIVDKYLPNWTTEIIDENNYHNGPCAEDGLADHDALQREYPADAVGFYCGLSSTMPRVWKVAQYYKSHGVTTIAGGWHVHYDPDESLQNGIDVVVRGDGEDAILKILSDLENGDLQKGTHKYEKADLDSIPVPDFGLLRFARVKIYPIGRIRGCSKGCEFCSVKGKPRWSQPEYLMRVIDWLVETRNAKSFFITDDRLEEDREGYIKFFDKVKEKYGGRLRFTVQMRLAAIDDDELIHSLYDAGGRYVCIGFESPIDEELRMMRKGLQVEEMVRMARKWHKLFFVHGMFIFGYPLPHETNITYQERLRQFKRFVRRGKLDSIQILRPVPLIGTTLRKRLIDNGQILPLNIVGWDKYDGNFACFKPKNMTLEELQQGPTKIMLSFYHWYAKFKLPFRTISLPFTYFIIGWSKWHRSWWNAVLRTGGYTLLRKWREQEKRFLETLRKNVSS